MYRNICLFQKICIFAEDKQHSAIRKQAFIALVCIIFAEDKRHSPNKKGTFTPHVWHRICRTTNEIF